MVLISPRVHFYEINDQTWFPQFLRERVQSGLTLAWSFRAPILQQTTPAKLVADTINRILGRSVHDYTFVDFCAGAGGPTPIIEHELNKQLGNSRKPSYAAVTNGDVATEPVQFVLTDLHPHTKEWEKVTKKNSNVSFVSRSVDAANAPADLIESDGKKQFRLFSLAFHHFDDPLAKDILKDALEKADGFAIFELQDRTISSMITVTAMGLLMFLISPYYFWNDPIHLFFTYVIPIVPFVLVVDGYTSALRTRTAGEIQALMKDCGASTKGWTVKSGSAVHTWPTGYMNYFMAVKK